MTVSITEGHTNVDLDAIVTGGDAFMARVKTLQQAKTDNEAALDALNIGRDVVAAMRDAQAREASAIKMIEDAKIESAKIIAGAQSQASEIIKQAQTDADALVAKAKSEADALSLQVKNAQDVLTTWSEKTKAEADTLMARAVRSKADADQQLADNRQAGEQLAAKIAEAEASHAAADEKRRALTAYAAEQAALNSKLGAI